MGYHKKEILPGELGQASKIREEFEEFMDAYNQDAQVMQICELCDIIGAIELYARKWNLTLQDLIQMKNLTASAFIEGRRK